MTPATFRLTPQNLESYLQSARLADSDDRIAVRELPGGVSNVVLMAEWVNNPLQRWVVKQSLGKLRVLDDWVSDQERIFREAASLSLLRPFLGDDTLPHVVHVDHANYLYVMTAAPPNSRVWKDSLLEGECPPRVAHSAGYLLSQLIRISQREPLFYELFADRHVFEQLRVDPYYRQSALRNPDVAKLIDELIQDSWKIRTSLVHGDYSPKNMLVSGAKVFLIDFEAVHWGDPAFDAGFLMSHLFLKAFRRPSLWTIYAEGVREFWKALRSGMEPKEIPGFEAMAIRHLGGLLLARVDGKSPVEYIQDETTKNHIREAAKQILRERPPAVAAVVPVLDEHLRELQS